MVEQTRLRLLREKITESLRIQKDSALIQYVDVGNALSDVSARQNHAIFGRRGCGKTLLLHHSAKELPADRRAIYLNCEDFKQHSFPNVLIEILVAVVGELEKNATGWFGRKRKIRDILAQTKDALNDLHRKPDETETDVKTTDKDDEGTKAEISSGTEASGTFLKTFFGISKARSRQIEREFKERNEKLERLNLFLPRFKSNLSDFFHLSTKVSCVFIHIDDLYHLKRTDQPFVVDYVHRLCKDLPLFFKIATLRHNSTLYIDSKGQPIGAQERHDYQPIDVDYTFSEFSRTEKQNLQILQEFGREAGLSKNEVTNLFKGEGFSRLVMAGGGVPRDVLSLFLQVLGEATQREDLRIGKDDIRILSRSVFERRIEDLKQDCKEDEQDSLLKGIYIIRQFTTDRKSNVFLIREQDMQRVDEFRALFYRLLDYRIIHSCANALTHKSREGTYQAFAVDIGSYANLRKLQNRFIEIDISSRRAKEQMRSAPVLEVTAFEDYAKNIPDDIESELLEPEPA